MLSSDLIISRAEITIWSVPVPPCLVSWAPCPPRVSGRIVPAQVVSPDPLSRLAANTKPKQNSLIVKTNFYSLLMHAFNAFTSQSKEAHQLFCDHSCFHPKPFEHYSHGTHRGVFIPAKRNQLSPCINHNIAITIQTDRFLFITSPPHKKPIIDFF